MPQETCDHHYWPQIRDDGLANIDKCGRCGHIRPWTIVDYAEAIASGAGRAARTRQADTPPPEEQPPL